jgi:hypothetical protein
LPQSMERRDGNSLRLFSTVGETPEYAVVEWGVHTILLIRLR